MTAVSAIYANRQIESAVNVADRMPLFDIVGLTPESAKVPTNMVAVSDYFTLLETIAQSEWPDVRFHMRTCQSWNCEDFGPFGLAFKSAPTMRHGFQRIWRYIGLHNRVSDFSAEERGGRFCWSMHTPPVARLGSFLSNEAAMATTLTLCRETSGRDLRPRHVQFVHEREGSIDALIAHFGRVPVFGADCDSLHFGIDQVDQPCAIGDAAIWNFLTGHLDQALASEDSNELPFETRVIEEISKLLSGGVPKLTEVSKNLGLGGRTFQRRLSERGKTFQSLVDEARQQLAQQLVSASPYSLAEVAFLTGFSEQSAFSRAFRRWSGQTPRAYRVAIQAESSTGPGKG